MRNLIGDGCTERDQSGLSRFGVEVVRRLNRLGIVVDVSHSGYRTTLDAIELSSRPVAVTHSFCRAVFDHPRGKSDDQLRALRDRDGYLGIVALPSFFAREGMPSLDDLLRHVAHAVSVVGVERVGIATDWGGLTPDVPDELAAAALGSFLRLGFREEDLRFHHQALQGFERWEDWPHITAALLAHGFRDAEARGLIGGNWLAFLRRALPEP